MDSPVYFNINLMDFVQYVPTLNITADYWMELYISRIQILLSKKEGGGQWLTGSCTF